MPTNLDASGVICEIMNDDGTMARRPELEAFAEKHELRVVTIAEIIAYRMAHESLVEAVVAHEVDTQWGKFTAQVVRSKVDQEHLALVKGDIDPNSPTLIRVQSVDLPADLIGLALSAGGAEMRAAMSLIAEAGSGVFVYLVRDGGEQTLSEKLSKLAADSTTSQSPRLGGRMDLRQFGEAGAQILKSIGVKKFRLMSNRDVRIVGIEGFDLEMVERAFLCRCNS